MRKGPLNKFEHLYHKSTQRKFVYHQVVPHANDLARDAALPIVYLDKDFITNVLSIDGLGAAPMLEITVRALYPDDDNKEIS